MLMYGRVPAQSMKKDTVVSTARMIAATVTHGRRIPVAVPEAVVSEVLVCSADKGSWESHSSRGGGVRSPILLLSPARSAAAGLPESAAVRMAGNRVTRDEES